MSRKLKRHYTGFSREILAEFMSEQELNELDQKYSEAKIGRMLRKMKAETGLK